MAETTDSQYLLRIIDTNIPPTAAPSWPIALLLAAQLAHKLAAEGRYVTIGIEDWTRAADSFLFATASAEHGLDFTPRGLEKALATQSMHRALLDRWHAVWKLATGAALGAEKIGQA